MYLQAFVQEFLSFRRLLWVDIKTPHTTQVGRPAGVRVGIPIVSAIVVGCNEDIRKTQVDGLAGFRTGILIVSAIVVG